MATNIHVKSTTEMGRNANEMGRAGRRFLEMLKGMNGTRLEAIAQGNAEMAAIFGIDDLTQAQDFSNRWADLVAELFDATDPNYGNYNLLREFIYTIMPA